MPNLERVNDLLRNELAQSVSRLIDLKNGIITVTYVNCSSDLKNASVGISILPEKITGSVLRELRKNTSQIASLISKKTRLRKTPRFRWIIDTEEKKAGDLIELIDKIQ